MEIFYVSIIDRLRTVVVTRDRIEPRTDTRMKQR